MQFRSATVVVAPFYTKRSGARLARRAQTFRWGGTVVISLTPRIVRRLSDVTIRRILVAALARTAWLWMTASESPGQTQADCDCAVQSHQLTIGQPSDL